ncbi:transposase [Halomonas sp.]|uniref:transposase n=1 Tax=Halomonas sp. TaxID=1486246 RepID=UPI00298EAA80|nr:transposase [Halomonas sp.]MDW7745622.1 transposase [Halomonas sp.]
MGQIELTAGRYRSLRLGAIAGNLTDLLDRAEANEVSYLAFADMLVEHERQTREAKRIDLYRRQAGFPSDKRLEGFDCRHQTTITKRQVNALLDFAFLDNRDNSSARRGWARSVRKKERRKQGHPKSLSWALLKSLENKNLTPKQIATLQELVADQSATSDAWVIKEKLRWIQKAPTPRAVRWRITNYLKIMKSAVMEKPLLRPVGKALATLERRADAVVRRWISGLTNARLEGMNGLFQAARTRARGYRNEANFISMIYLIGSPVGRLFDKAKST